MSRRRSPITGGILPIGKGWGYIDVKEAARRISGTDWYREMIEMRLLRNEEEMVSTAPRSLGICVEEDVGIVDSS